MVMYTYKNNLWDTQMIGFRKLSGLAGYFSDTLSYIKYVYFSVSGYNNFINGIDPEINHHKSYKDYEYPYSFDDFDTVADKKVIPPAFINLISAVLKAVVYVPLLAIEGLKFAIEIATPTLRSIPDAPVVLWSAIKDATDFFGNEFKKYKLKASQYYYGFAPDFSDLYVSYDLGELKQEEVLELEKGPELEELIELENSQGLEEKQEALLDNTKHQTYAFKLHAAYETFVRIIGNRSNYTWSADNFTPIDIKSRSNSLNKI